MRTVIGADQSWALWAVLLSAAAFGLWAERTTWGRKVSSAVLTIGATFALSNLRVIPVSSPVYDVVWTYFVPLAIPLLLLRANLQRILREAGPTLLAFTSGAVGTVLGTLIAFQLVPLGPEGYKLAGIFCATYIGGSLNYVAASEVLDLQSGDLLAAGIAADNLVMTLYLLVLFALPSIPALRRRYVERHLENHDGTAGEAGPDAQPATPFRLFDTAAALAIAAVLCAVGYALAAAIGMSRSAMAENRPSAVSAWT